MKNTDSFPKADIGKDLRAYILGDDDLALYCLNIAAEVAIEKGEEAICDLLDHCGCDFVQDEVDRGGDPEVVLKRLLYLARG
jgi:hypothetical protein